jgi:hypothetical protein
MIRKRPRDEADCTALVAVAACLLLRLERARLAAVALVALELVTSA